ncbi:transcription factor 25 [Condylostylus longicornis]|uniref:transcription factor 25 n=1 Tax=Condylostylus longicornis TaxID=2530218 RepID=UPI00244E24EA|nr:transcription factor 25 [Condylostylus longicornis]
MSSRVLKKLQSNNDPLAEPKVDDFEEEEDEETIDSGTFKKPLNRFDLLNQQSPSESEVKEDDNETEHHSTAANIPSSISKKKKKKRKKKSTKHSAHHISSEDNEQLNEKYLSEIDPFLERTTRSPRITGPVQTCENYKSLLSIEFKNLNAQYEMRRTFGKRVVKIENKRGRPKPTLKSTYLVTARESWPPVTKDIISMKPCEPPALTTNEENLINHSAATWFAFEHSKFYQSVQSMFLSAVESTDSDFLVSLIKRCPYHVDSLIQLSELCKITENFAMATELIERAVLILESSLHPSFSLISGNCRLDYRRQENRAFFIVLFKHAQYLEAKACCRTAFEVSKLILSVNSDDPLAMLLVIDYYAIRSKQYAWLVKFYDEWETLRNLSQLPNMAYSYALAQFFLNGECEEADKSLQYALLMFPGVLKLLLDELSVQTDSRILGSTYFNSGVSGSQSPSLHQLVCLYVCRAKVIWRDSNVLPWLEKNVNTVLDRIDAKDDVIADYSQKRSQRYVTPPRAILRHVFLADYKEKVPLAPFLVKEKEPVMMYDPLPPLDSVNFYERKSSSSSPTSNTRPVSMFFQSMLPTFNLQMQGRQNNDIAPAAEGGAQNENRNQPNNGGQGNVAELGQSLTSIVEAMREFLSNIRFYEVQGGDGEGNESSEEDSTDYDD